MTESFPGQNTDPLPFVEAYGGDIQRITNIFYGFVATILISLVAGIFIVLSVNDIRGATILAIGMIPVLASLYFVRRQQFEITAVFLSVVAISIITLIATRGLGVHHISILGYPAILIVASLVSRKRVMALITLYNILCVAWLVFGELSGAFTPTRLVRSVVGDFFSVSVILIATAFMVRSLSETLFRSLIQLKTELGERKMADEKIRRQAAHAEVLAALSNLLTQANQDYQLVLDTAVRRAAELIGDGASIFLYSPDSQFLELAAVYNPDPRAIFIFRDEIAVHPIRADEGAYAQVIHSKQPVLIPAVPLEALIERATPERREYYRKLPLHSLMLAPLQAQGKILGIIGMARHVPNKNYTPEDLTLLQDIADRSALAMLNAQLYSELEQELKERKLAEENYRNIFDNAIEGIFQSSPEGYFLSVNPAMARMYGYDSPTDMLLSINDITTQIYVNPEARVELRKRLDRGEKLTDFESQDYRRDGSVFWTSMNVQAIYNKSGALLYYEGTAQDITQHKKSDEALRESEERYRTLFNNMLDGIYRSTPAGRFVDVNPALIKMLGYQSRAEMLELDIPQSLFFAPEERIVDYLAPGEERVDVFRMKRKDGSEIWAEDHGHDLHDAQGHTLFHEGILRDVTPRIIAEAERQRAENELLQFKNIMDESNDAIFIIDPVTSQHSYVNRRACQLLGYTAYEFSKLGVVKIEAQMPDLEAWQQRVELVRTHNGLIFETNYRHKAGMTFPVEVSARLLQYADGDHVVAFARDITERKQAESERELLIGELEAKNNELTQFTYTVSHDLKSPLVTINGFLGYLEQDVAAGNLERVKLDRQRIQGAVNKMHALLTELLELSRIGRMMNEAEDVPFEAMVKSAVDIVHGRLEVSNVTIHTQPDLPIVHGDRQRLTEVLQNLLDNAAKYMGDQLDPLIEIGQRGEEAGKPIFFVKDNGIGIALEYHERIFGLFNKLDSRSEGTGIGLALVKRIVEVHGGRIWVESELGQGATFYFTLEPVKVR